MATETEQIVSLCQRVSTLEAIYPNMADDIKEIKMTMKDFIKEIKDNYATKEELKQVDLKATNADIKAVSAVSRSSKFINRTLRRIIWFLGTGLVTCVWFIIKLMENG